MRAKTLLPFAFIFAFAGGAFAQTAETGAIIGRVLETATPLLGATVEARSSALQGVRSQVTDSHGSFRFPLLPPGQYTLTAVLAGFVTVSQKDIVVNLATTLTVDLAFHAATSQEITVSAAAPVIDVTSTLTGVNISADTMQRLPLDRNYLAVAQIAPGISKDGLGTTFYGSTSLENEYIIDGLNTTDVYVGQGSKNVNLDFVQEVEVMSGGLSAEYGRITGGIVNAITKSGSNDFHGAVFDYTAGGSLRSKPKHPDPNMNLSSDVDRQSDYGTNLGGYILKDRLWFFGAYDLVRERDLLTTRSPLVVPGFSLPAGGSIPQHRTSNLAAAKLTFAVTTNQLFNASLFGDPNVFEGNIGAISGPPSTFEGVNKQGGNDFVGRYSAVLGERWNVDALVGRNVQTTKLTGAATGIPLLIDTSQIPIVVTGGSGQFTNQKARRDVVKIDTATVLFNRHTFKFGVDQESPQSADSRFVSGGDQVTKRCTANLVNNQCPPDAVYYTHLAYLNDRSPTFNIHDPATFSSNVINPLTIHYVAHNRSAYIQDSWVAMPTVTIDAGVRFERQVLDNGNGENTLHVDNLSPRLGIVWDVSKDGRSKVYGYFGRFFESLSIRMEQALGANGIILNLANLDPTPGHITPDPMANPGASRATPVFGQEAVAPNLKGQYIDEYLIGYDREIGSTLVAGVKGVYRNLGRVMEDTCPDSGCIIVNPGSGPGQTIEMFSGEFVPTPKPIRRYTGVELHATKRLSSNLEFFASYLWSRLYGNYDGLLSVGGQNDPNLDAVYDYGDFMINSYGPLSRDQTHQIKLYGSYHLPNGFAKGLNIGLATHWYSGTPLTAMNHGIFFLTPRGALGRGPSDYEADLHLGYPIAPHNRRVEIVADVFNLLNRQAPNSLDLEFNGFYGPSCAGIPANFCYPAGSLRNKPGTTEPLGQLPDPRATAPDPHFLQPKSFTGQRSIRLGARFQF